MDRTFVINKISSEEQVKSTERAAQGGGIVMKGYSTDIGFMGLVDGKYVLFCSESEYYEFMKEQ